MSGIEDLLREFQQWKVNVRLKKIVEGLEALKAEGIDTIAIRHQVLAKYGHTCIPCVVDNELMEIYNNLPEPDKSRFREVINKWWANGEIEDISNFLIELAQKYPKVAEVLSRSCKDVYGVPCA